MTWMKITGYADKFSVHPGDTIKFSVNCDGPGEYQAEIVKMIHADTNPRGPGFIEESIKASCDGTYKGMKQEIYSGSYGFVVDKPQFCVESVTLQCWIWPTTPKTHPKYWKHGAQGLVTKWHDGKGYGLFINEEGCVEFRVNDQVITTGAPLRDHAWHFVAASFDAKTGEAILYHEPQIVYALDPEIEPVTKKLAIKLVYTPGTPTVIAGYCGALSDAPQAKASVPAGILIKGHYNGKIDSPRIANRALSRLEIETMKLGAQPGLSERRNSGPTGKLSEAIVASWDFSDGINTLAGKDKGPYLFHATIVNCPTRAMTGYNWEGQVFDWKTAPEQYGAIHFHDDDIDDARWATSFEWTVPKGTSSKFYAAKLTSKDGGEDYIPFWVVPRVGEETAKIAYMVPTISYMAYATSISPTTPAAPSFWSIACQSCSSRTCSFRNIVNTADRSTIPTPTAAASACRRDCGQFSASGRNTITSWRRRRGNIRPTCT